MHAILSYDPNCSAIPLTNEEIYEQYRVPGGDISPPTQRSLDTEVKELRAEINKLRDEMDQLLAKIGEARSRQVNGAGYWEET